MCEVPPRGSHTNDLNCSNQISSTPEGISSNITSKKLAPIPGLFSDRWCNLHVPGETLKKHKEERIFCSEKRKSKLGGNLQVSIK